MSLAVGLGGASRNACVTLAAPDRILGVCEQERITRVRAAGFNRTGLPDEALDVLLERSGTHRADITKYALADDVPALSDVRLLRLEHHFAHACSAFFPSAFETAAIVVCDHEDPQVSVWIGRGNDIAAIDWPWQGQGFASLYSKCAETLGFTNGGLEQRMEALARLAPAVDGGDAAQLFKLDGDRLSVEPSWQRRIEESIHGADLRRKSQIASALQHRIGELLLEFIQRVQRRVPETTALCLGGSLFHNSYFNAQVKTRSSFERFFVPVNPGNGGLSVGAALHANRGMRLPVTPYLGPSYDSEEIKATLDNCKLTYQWASEAETIAIAVEELRKGRLLAWFDGPMEWGPRALGARSILASPLAPYVLDNLNRFLKRREVWRGYALSGLEPNVDRFFEGPAVSSFMECDYLPNDRALFRSILPSEEAAVRIHTVGDEALPRFRSLLQQFGAATGVPFLVNTSFNGFQEPIVCSPRDAIRVFYGTGIDVLVLGQFVIRK